MLSLFKSSNEKGQGLVEYALILVLVAIVVIAVLLVLGPAVSQVYCEVATGLQPGVCGPISKITPDRQNASLVKVTVEVSETTEVSCTMVSGNGSVSNSPQTCSPSSPCQFNITSANGAGSAKIQATDATWGWPVSWD